MVKYGVHSLLWTERLDTEPEPMIKKAKELGFDGIEIYVSPQQLESFDRKRVKRALENAKMKCIGSTSLTLETDITSPDEATRRRGIDYLKNCAKMFSELGGGLVAGVLYAAWGKIVGRGRTEEEWVRSLESLKEASRLVRGYDVVLGLEPVNRFETYFLNTAADAVKLVEAIDEPNVKVHLDTFHMNIEEKNYYDPIVNTGELLCHMHCCENDRGVAGTGSVDWDEVFRGLAEIGYNRWITLESFTPEIKSVAASTAVWRQLAPSPEALASEGLKFLKSMEKKYLRR
ncbi:MAG: sugar phosphate isomerase/epimerase [Aigarchaeota archaeon]|nr:sugar phosphate isomerase/epimerase [Aigarchaeota archaeon]